jgi:hypothetical protein
MPSLRIPAALAFTLLGTAVAASCGKDAVPPPVVVDAACVPCVYQATDNGNCPPPTCATGPENDVCPEGCIPAPVG